MKSQRVGHDLATEQQCQLYLKVEKVFENYCCAPYYWKKYCTETESLYYLVIIFFLLVQNLIPPKYYGLPVLIF